MNTKTLNILLALAVLATGSAAHATQKAYKVLVKKSERKMYLLDQERKPFRTYHVALGPNARAGHKERDGDERTPEGMYILDYKKSPSFFYKAIRISYPNRADIERARRAGVNPGGAIMIHGQPENSDWPPEIAQRFNWTNGCIAVTNEEMDEIWEAVDVGTLIEIQP